MTTSRISIQGIFNTAKAFFATLERELNDPVERKAYEEGKKAPYLLSVLPVLTDTTSTFILERHTSARASNNASRELTLLAGIYYELVTASYDLAKIQSEDITPNEGIALVLDQIRTQMANLTEVQELDELRENLSRRTLWYLDKPELRRQVQTSAAVLSAAYTVYAAKSLSDYQNQEILAEVSLTDVSTAEVAKLPPGLEINNTNGAIFVQKKEDLVRGDYSLNVTTADEKGGLSTHAMTLRIGEDQPAVYVMKDPQMFNTLKKGDELGSVVDPDRLESAEILDGKLPPGVRLDAQTGLLYVALETALRPGNWVAAVKTTDRYGWTTDHTLSFSILGDSEAQYTIRDPRSFEEYQEGTLLASAFDPDGKVVAAEVSGLPPGIKLNEKTGSFYVSNQKDLVAGTYMVSVNLTSEIGKRTSHFVQIILEPDQESKAAYKLDDPRDPKDYKPGDLLAEYVDVESALVSVKVTWGTVPPGTRLNRINGNIEVANPSSLISQQYPLTLSTVNIFGDSTVHKLVLRIGVTPVYVTESAKPADLYQSGDLLAYLQAPGSPIISAKQKGGNLPSGAKVNPENGEIRLGSSFELKEGKYEATVSVVDQSRTTFVVPVKIRIDAESGLKYTYAAPKVVSLYETGDLIGWISSKAGEVISARVSRGLLPRGIRINEINGTLTVSDPSLLFAGNHVGSEVEVSDLFGNKQTLELDFSLLPVPEIIYTITSEVQISDLKTGTLLAKLSHGEEMLQAVQMIGGVLPPGCSLNMVTGIISVSSQDQLRGGHYAFKLLTFTLDGKEKEHNLKITLLPLPAEENGSGPPSSGSDEVVKTSLIPYLDSIYGDAKARNISLEAGGLSGSLKLDTDKILHLADPDEIVAGTYPLSLLVKTPKGKDSIHNLQLYLPLPFKVPGYLLNDNLATRTLRKGQMLAYPVFLDRPVKEYALTSDQKLPPGTELDELTGAVRVTNPRRLKPGEYQCTVYMDFADGRDAERTLHFTFTP